MKRIGLSFLFLFASAATAAADAPTRPKTGYEVTWEETDPGELAGAASERYNRIIYVNLDGGTYTPATSGEANDSSNNISTIANNVATIGPWEKGEDARAQVMSCVVDMFDRFNITVTDEDPGDKQHIEAAFGGRPEDLGLSPDVGGIAPSAPGCEIVDRAIVFVFDVWGNDTQEICHTIAQEAGHAFGLDHEFLCEDPMTYLFGCGPKTFQDIDAECGEYEARLCSCGRQTQNSVVWLLDKVGAPDPVPPMHTMTQPDEGATLLPAFAITGETSDDRGIHFVELWIDGEYVESTPLLNYTFNAPSDLPFGAHVIETRAVDLGGNEVPQTRNITLEAECEGTTGCEATETCVAGVCLGALGGDCDAHVDCATGSCGNDPAGGMRCTQGCDSQDPTSCPEGFQCSASGQCWAASGDGGGGGCQTGGRGAAPLAAGVVFLMMLFLVRRRA